MIEDDKPYEVGYGKPPRHTRFVKGRSGNPRGRPRKAASNDSQTGATRGPGRSIRDAKTCS